VARNIPSREEGKQEKDILHIMGIYISADSFEYKGNLKIRE